LVVEAILGGGSNCKPVRLMRVFIRPSRSPFFGVVPGVQAVPLGQIDLPVTFGDANNFRSEILTFEVVDFEGSYHAILRRPCYAKFMAVPNYTYLKLKMPGPGGAITVGSKASRAHKCDKENCELAERVVAKAELHQIVRDLVETTLDSRKAFHHRHLQADRGLEDGAGQPPGPIEDCSDRHRARSEIGKRARQLRQGEHRQVHMETLGHEGDLT
jgi:hypothetical protein